MKYYLLLTFILFAFYCSAQQKNQRDQFKYFIGEWTGDGEFANGKKISADVSFKFQLDSAWVSYQHTDRPPNRYNALSVWGYDKASGKFISQLFDNFGGSRKFTGPGWEGSKFVLTIDGPKPIQRFVYEKLDTRSFKMTYEVSQDGVNWRMGDYLVFKRK